MIQNDYAGTERFFGPRVFFVLALALGVMSFAGCTRETGPTGAAVTWESVDGVTLHAQVYAASSQAPPGLILVHDIGGNKSEWDLFAGEMQQRGFQSIVIDLRGHGESVNRGDQSIRFGTFTPEDWAMAQDDLIVAKLKLLDSGADPNNLFVVGAGLGGSLALRHAVEDAEIQGAVILSPQRSTRGISIERLVASNRRLPLLFVATEGDSYSANSAAELKASSEAYCETRIYRGSTQGTDILASNDNVTPDILAWLDPIVK